MATSLRTIQEFFASTVMSPLVDGDTNNEHEREIEKIIKPNDRLTSLERIQLYNRQYWYRIIDSFEEDFPGVQAFLGSELFREITIDYIATYPSRSYTLRHLGQDFEKYLRESKLITSKQRDIALELAQIEWAHMKTFEAGELTPASASDLVAVDPNNLYLKLQPHVILLKLSYPFDEFLIDLRRKEREYSEAARFQRTETAPKTKAKLPKKKETWLAVHRHDFTIFYKPLDKHSFLLLQKIGEGSSLGEACEAAAASMRKSRISSEEIPQKIMSWFSEWGTLGWLSVSNEF